MRCNHVQDLLAAYLDGGITDAETRAEIDAHLEGCPICQAERDSLAGTLAHVASAVKAAGDAIAIPDVQWQGTPARTYTRTRFRPILGAKQAKPSVYPDSQNGRKPLMQHSPNLSPTGRRSPLAGVLTFAISLAVLVGAWLIFNASMRNGVSAGPNQDVTETPTEEAAVVTAEPTATAWPTNTPEPTIDPLTITGGFVDNQMDVSTLPEYEISGSGGGGGGGGGGCPEIDPTETVTLVGDGPVAKRICLYDIPSAWEGTQFSVKLTSPQGKEYSSDFEVMSDKISPDLLDVVKSGGSPEFDTAGYFQTGTQRNAFDMTLYFQAAQEYGEWQIEASTDAGVFASGTINVVAHEPIYSVSPLADLPVDPLDPFEGLGTYIFFAGDHLLFAGRGLEPWKETILALYSYDPARSTNTMTVMVPYYATHLTFGEDGTFRAEFVVGSETFGNKAPGAYFTAVFDPQPGEFKPEAFGMTVNP